MKMRQNKKMGRPMVRANTTKVDLHVSVDHDTKEMIRLSGMTAGAILQYGAKALLGDYDIKELNKVNQELLELEPKYFELKAKQTKLLQEIEQKKEERKKQESQARYMVEAFREIVNKEKANGKITVKMEWIEDVYGISFDKEKVNSNFTSVLEELKLHILPEYLFEKYRIIKSGRGERENRILLRIEELVK
jgi:hypothetical protein